MNRDSQLATLPILNTAVAAEHVVKNVGAARKVAGAFYLIFLFGFIAGAVYAEDAAKEKPAYYECKTSAVCNKVGSEEARAVVLDKRTLVSVDKRGSLQKAEVLLTNIVTHTMPYGFDGSLASE